MPANFYRWFSDRQKELTSFGRARRGRTERARLGLLMRYAQPPPNLRGISIEVRQKLKRQGISYTHQLLREAGSPEQRRRLVERSRIDDPTLLRLVRRADLARVKGIGAIFADMLEMIGIDQVAALAEQDPLALRTRLYALNAAERLARRAPTPEEVQEWIGQARALPRMVDAG